MKTSEALYIARVLLDKHDLQRWRPVIDTRPKRRLGQCRYTVKEIGLTAWYVTKYSYKEVVDTILHEIAHALTPGHHHDRYWKSKAQQIGANPKRNKTNLEWVPQHKWTATCPKCRNTWKYRARRWNNGAHCLCIYNQEDKQPLIWKQNY